MLIIIRKLFFERIICPCVCFFHLTKFFRYIAVKSTNYQQRIVFKVEKTAAVFLFLPNCTTAVSFLWSVLYTPMSKGNWLEKKIWKKASNIWLEYGPTAVAVL